MYRRVLFLSTAVAVVAMTAFVVAGEAKEEAPSGEQKWVEIEAKVVAPANTVNFAGELNLPFESLIGLGGRIEAARRTADPVELAAAAQYLAAAEKAAGKQASLTSESLMEEAVELAKLRRSAAELKAVAALAGDGRSGELQKLAQVAARESKEAQAALEAGEETRHISELICVHNNSDQYVTVFADGRRLGEVEPGRGHHFHLYGQHARHYITGQGCMGTHWHQSLQGLHGKQIHLRLLPCGMIPSPHLVR